MNASFAQSVRRLEPLGNALPCEECPAPAVIRFEHTGDALGHGSPLCAECYLDTMEAAP